MNDEVNDDPTSMHKWEVKLEIPSKVMAILEDVAVFLHLEAHVLAERAVVQILKDFYNDLPLDFFENYGSPMVESRQYIDSLSEFTMLPGDSVENSPDNEKPTGI